MVMDVIFGFRLSADFVKTLLDAWRATRRWAGDASLLVVLYQYVPRVWTA
jgi:hypothetical protein